MLKKHVVIVGGGWAGLSLVRKLKKIPTNKIRITLISDTPNFLFNAALYRVATGYREREAILPISELTNDIPNLKFTKGHLKSIDKDKKTLKLDDGTTIHYDYVVLAIGSVTNYFRIPGLKELSYSIKSPRELHRFKAKLHQHLLDKNTIEKNYVIVGGGPTGVELAASLVTYLKQIHKRHGLNKKPIHVDLLEASNKLLPIGNLKASEIALERLRKLGVRVHLNAKVESENEGSLVYNGKIIPTRTVIWTAGTTNHPFFFNNQNDFALNERGKVIVDNHLRVDSGVYVIGDNANTPYSGLAITAIHNAKYVAKEIKKQLSSRNSNAKYVPAAPMTVIPIGPHWAIFQYKKYVFSGYLAGFMRLIADLIGYIDIAGFKRGFKYWLNSRVREENCHVCKLAIENN